MISRAENPAVTAEVHLQHGDVYKYHHTIAGMGPDGRNGIVEVYCNEAVGWDDRRTVHVLDGKVLSPF